MRLLSLSLIFVLFSCKSSMHNIGNDFTSGQYLLLNVEEKTFSESENYIVNIDTVQKRMSGNLGCNDFSVDYTLGENNSIKFGYAISTKMYCEGEMELENEFFKKLNSIKFFKFEDNQLRFTNENKKLILKFKRINE